MALCPHHIQFVLAHKISLIAILMVTTNNTTQSEFEYGRMGCLYNNIIQDGSPPNGIIQGDFV